MAAINQSYDNTSTWQETWPSRATTTITVNFNDTSYSSNYPDSAYEPQPDEEGLLQERRALHRQWSIDALLELKYQHGLARPAARPDVGLCYARRHSAQRRSITAVRNWRRC